MRSLIIFTTCFCAALTTTICAHDDQNVTSGSSALHPDPVTNPDSQLMLTGDWVPTDPHQIDQLKLPKIPSEHVIVNDVHHVSGVNQHNYLVYHKDKFFVMWSDGPGIEDRAGQRVKFATSRDGLQWTEAKYLTPEPPLSGPDSPYFGTRTAQGYRYISRGFWQRDGELYALASLDEAAGFFGPSLELHAFQLKSDGISWEDTGVIANNAINNFPPKRIPTGEWMMSRRTYNYSQTGVDFLVGGVKSMRDWESYPVLGTNSQLKAEEPVWWVLPDNNLMALFRDNRGSKFLYRAFSTDNGRTWSKPVRTNFPDATSKLFGLRLNDGRYVLISNSNPRARDPLTLAISDDGIVFNKLGYLVGGRHVDYPHAIEHEGSLLVAYAGGKQTVELLKIRLSDIDKMSMPNSVESAETLSPIPKPATTSASDWIDLGNEGETLYVITELTVPMRGRAVACSLATYSAEERVAIGVDAKGRLTGGIYRDKVKGPKLNPGETLSLLIRIVSHHDKPDELFVLTGPPDKIPKEPATQENWSLTGLHGSSDANLARIIQRGNPEQFAFRNFRIAKTYAKLSTAKPISH